MVDPKALREARGTVKTAIARRHHSAEIQSIYDALAARGWEVGTIILCCIAMLLQNAINHCNYVTRCNQSCNTIMV